jgi:predicted MPP superfamily phosphohydrolase
MKNLTVIDKEITVSGLKKSYRILHLTDVHIIHSSEADDDTIINYGVHSGKPLISRFGKRRVPIFTKDGIEAKAMFSELCDFLKANPDFVDAVILTGDVLDFYTDAAVDFVCENLKKLPMPYMFTMGNHDSIFSTHSDKEVKEIFDSLCGGDTEIQKLKLGELTFIGADNNHYSYNSSTVDKIKEATMGEENVIICQHVPLHSDSLAKAYEAVGHPNLAIGNNPEKADNYKAIMEIVCAESSPVKAFLCGDSHIDYSGPLTDSVTQHISPLLAAGSVVVFTIKA